MNELVHSASIIKRRYQSKIKKVYERLNEIDNILASNGIPESEINQINKEYKELETKARTNLILSNELTTYINELVRNNSFRHSG